MSWQGDQSWGHLLDLTRRLLRLRAEHPVLRQRYFFEGVPLADGRRKDVSWLQADGEEMTGESWGDSQLRTLGVFLAGDALRARTTHGVRLHDTSYLIWLHAGGEPVQVTLPKAWADRYLLVYRSDADPSPASGPDSGSELIAPGSAVTLLDHTFALFEAVTDAPAGQASGPDPERLDADRATHVQE